MNTQKNNFELYRSAFDEVHASDELMRKVKNMTESKPKKKIYVFRKVLYVAAAVAVLLVASNVITYAATGETWVEQVMVNITLNGEQTEVPITHTVNDDGSQEYEYNYEVKDGDGTPAVNFSIEGDDPSYMEINTHSYDVVNEDEKTYFVDTCDENLKVDITEDIKDGTAEGTFEQYGLKYNFTIEESDDGYLISVDIAE